LWLATGHEGLGVTTSLGTAKLLVACMLNDPPTPGLPDLAPFSPRRFVVAHADE